MKLVLSALLASVALSAITTLPASATMPEPVTTCTTVANSPNPPSGTYVAPDGHKWAGFKADGMPPDSLISSAGSSTTCVTVTNDPS